MAPKTYVYTPLNESDAEIRVLKLVKANSAAEIKCELITTSIAKAPPFYALSYRWGSTDKSKPISCNALPLHVTPDLETALRHLQQLGHQESDREYKFESQYLWIDQICINQSDLDERAQQVRMMQSIYSASLKTLVWLGPEDDFASDALAFLDHVYDICRKQYPKAKESLDIPNRSYTQSQHEALQVPYIDSPAWTAFRKLATAAWFRRIWVIQEVVVSPTDPWIIFGRSVYTWEKLSWASTWLVQNGFITRLQVPHELLNIVMIAEVRRSAVQWSLGSLLAELTPLFDSQDPRDKVFALVAMSIDVKGLQVWPGELQPSYRKSPQDVHRDVTRYIVSKSEDLACWSAPSHGKRSHNPISQRLFSGSTKHLLSWVPDWALTRYESTARPVGLAETSASNDGREFVTLDYLPQFRAFPQTTIKLGELKDSNILSLTGFSIDVVKYCSPALARLRIWLQESPTAKVSARDQLGDEVKFVSKDNRLAAARWAAHHFNGLGSPEIFTEWKHMARMMDNVSPDVFNTAFAMATTCGDRPIGVGEKDPDHRLQNFCAYIKHWIDVEGEVEERMRKRSLKLAPFYTYMPGSTETQSVPLLEHVNHIRANAEGGEQPEYIKLVQDWSHGRRIFATKEGRIGVGPPDMKSGDKVCALFGGQALYVLRSHRGAYILLGDAYVHGLMNGEVPEMLKRGELKSTTFDIK